MRVRLSKCSISDAEVNAVSIVMKAEYLGMGSKVLEFEELIKKYIDTSMEVVCVNTGTSALELALSALDIGIGDEVLVPSLTYVGTFQAISATGATPVACEIDESNFFLSIADARSKITSNTKAIMPVHYASASEGMSDVYALASEFGLRVIEDAAQAFGCMRDGKKIGSNGDILCFSFDGIKNITCGEGGAILTKDPKVTQRLKDGRLLGILKDSEKRYAGARSWDFDVHHQGFRFHMSNINAAIGIVQLSRIEEFKLKRQRIAKNYIEAFSEIQELAPLELNYDHIIPHIFVIKANHRDRLREHLINNNIECGLHYKPNHMLTKYNNGVQLPVTEYCYGMAITLPCHVDITDCEQQFVIERVREFYLG